MGNYYRNKTAAITKNTRPSLTDQSAARATDRNVIVGNYLKTGMAPPTGKTPMFGDFSQLPTDLASYVHMARNLSKHRAKLPEKLRNMPTQQLLSLTNEQLKAILAPPAPEPAKTEDKK